MSHENPNDDTLREILERAATIAVVGASSNPDRPSNAIFSRLLAQGYRVIPVSPNETEVLGQKAFPSLEAIGEPVDIVDVFRRAEQTPDIAREAAKIGARVLWLQLGISNEETANIAKAAGMTVVMDTCIAVSLARLRIPKKG